MPSKEEIQATEEVAMKTRLSAISRTFLRQHDLDQVQGSPCRPALLAPMASQPPAGAPLVRRQTNLVSIVPQVVFARVTMSVVATHLALYVEIGFGNGP